MIILELYRRWLPGMYCCYPFSKNVASLLTFLMAANGLHENLYPNGLLVSSGAGRPPHHDSYSIILIDQIAPLLPTALFNLLLNFIRSQMIYAWVETDFIQKDQIFLLYFIMHCTQFRKNVLGGNHVFLCVMACMFYIFLKADLSHWNNELRGHIWDCQI